MEVLYGALTVARQADTLGLVVGAFVLILIEHSERSPGSARREKKIGRFEK
jgi:hypothetical protein